MEDQQLEVPPLATIGVDVYSGISGITLALAECDANLAINSFDLVEAAVRQIKYRYEVEADSLQSPGFFTGASGVLAVLDRAIRLRPLNSSTCMRDVDDIIQRLFAEIERSLNPSGKDFDLIGGLAGTITGLLAARGRLGHDAVNVACRAGHVLLEGASSHDGGGLSWSTASSSRQVHLVGLSHGSSGPGLAFAELYAATGEPHWAEASRAAFAYERHWFSNRCSNWPDLRNVTSSNSLRRLPYRTMWCHGAPGIGLARAHASVLLDDSDLESECAIAMASTEQWLDEAVQWEVASPSLCHGLAGNADILLTCASLLGQDRWRSAAHRVAGILAKRIVAMTTSEMRMTPPGLMLGWSGIMMFLLRSRQVRSASPLHLNSRD